MDTAEFRQRGKEMVDYMCQYMETLPQRTVVSKVSPGYLRSLVPSEPPTEPEPWTDIMADVEDKIMPGITHWQHPRFHAYFPSGNSYPSILGDMLSDIIGCIGFSWAASPACIELETIVLDWMAKALGLPHTFLSDSKGGGVIQGSASECVLTCMLAARAEALRRLHEANITILSSEHLPSKVKNLPRLVAYCSKEAHSCVEKAAIISLVQLRILEPDNNNSLRGEILREVIEADKAEGLVPFFVLAVIGSTGSCSFDNLLELGPVAKEHELWLHVDAAYAGCAMVCPEQRYLIRGVENVDSFNTNPNKFFLTCFDCSLLWVKERMKLIQAFTVDPLYLKHEHEEEVFDYRHWGIPLSRRFRSLKLWFVIRSFGISGLQEYIRNHIRLARRFKDHVLKDKRFELMNDVRLGLVCFRLCSKGDKLTDELLVTINHSGKLHMIPARIKGKYIIRFCLTALQATEADIDYAWSVISDFATELLASPDREDRKLSPHLALTRSAISIRASKSEMLLRSKLHDGATPIIMFDDDSDSDSNRRVGTDTAEFRKRGKEMVDYMCQYMETLPQRTVASKVSPGYLRSLVPSEPPTKPEPWTDIMADVEDKIMPGITHWQHPRFHAYFPSGNSYPSILGDMLSDIIGCIGFSWAASPACTELETIVLDWMAKALGLPHTFLSGSKGGGVIQGSASECVLTCMLAARKEALRRLHDADMTMSPSEHLHPEAAHLRRLVAYCSKEAHSCVEKAAIISLVQLRILEPDNNNSLRGEILREAIEKDKAEGLVPFFVSAIIGSTASCSFDYLLELGPVAKEHELWLHVDAAYAGCAMVCPEQRYLIRGVENVDSFNTNPNKFFLTCFDCSLLWVKERMKLIQAFNVDSFYLQHEHEQGVFNYRHWGIPLSRRFRSLKLWFVIRSFGISGLQEYIRNHIRLARRFKDHVLKDKRFELMNDVRLGLVCFRLCSEGDKLTAELLATINQSGKLHMVPARIKGRYIIRFCLTAQQATDADIDYAWSVISDFATELLASPDRQDCKISPHLAFTRSIAASKSATSLGPKLYDGATPIIMVDDDTISFEFYK